MCVCLIRTKIIVLPLLLCRIAERNISIHFSCPECTVTFSILCYQRVLLLALTSITDSIARFGSTIVLRIGTAQFEETGKALVADVSPGKPQSYDCSDGDR